MKIEYGTYEVDYHYWTLWFGTDKPHLVKGTEIIQLSHDARLPLDFLMQQVYLVRYNVHVPDYTIGLTNGYDAYKHKLNEYIPKYVSTIFYRPSKEIPFGNVHKFKADQRLGKGDMVFRVQPRPIRGYRSAFVNRMRKWVNVVNHWTQNGHIDGYPCEIIRIHQPIKRRNKKPKTGDCKNQPYDYIMIQVPQEYANIMIDDGYFPAEYQDYTTILGSSWPRKWKFDISPEAQAEVVRKMLDGLERWREKHRTEVIAEQEYKRDSAIYARWLKNHEKTGIKTARDYEYNRFKPIIIT